MKKFISILFLTMALFGCNGEDGNESRLNEVEIDSTHLLLLHVATLAFEDNPDVEVTSIMTDGEFGLASNFEFEIPQSWGELGENNKFIDLTNGEFESVLRMKHLLGTYVLSPREDRTIFLSLVLESEDDDRTWSLYSRSIHYPEHRFELFAREGVAEILENSNW